MGLFSSGGSSSRSGSALKAFKPIAKAAAGDTRQVFEQNQAGLQNLTNQVQGLVPDIMAKYRAGSPSLDAAQGYVTDILGGGGANPHLDAMMARNAADVTSRVGAAYGSRGSFGGTAWTTALGKAISDSNLGLMYGDHNTMQDRMASAAGMAPSIAQGQYAGLPEIMQAGGLAAEIPYSGINAQAGALQALFDGSKSKTKGPGLGASIMGGAAAGAGQAAASAAMAGSDPAIKENIVKVGELDDGLGVYEWDYRQDMGLDLPTGRHRGVMADEVQALRPQAYVPDFIGGFAGVNYAAL
jgi:hypothetical protein